MPTQAPNEVPSCLSTGMPLLARNRIFVVSTVMVGALTTPAPLR